MPDNPPIWRNFRFPNSHRHEIFFGTSNRKLSIKDGLIIYLTPEMHNGSKEGIHQNHEFDMYAKRFAERVWLDYYNKTIDDFIERYGINVL